MILKLLLAAILACATALVLGLTMLAGTAPAIPASAAALCVTTGPLPGLSAAASKNAHIVIAAAEPIGGHQGAIDAVAAGLTESNLLVLGNSDGQQGGEPVQGVGTNYDSLGIFQQRPSWGTVQQRLDPEISTVLFMNRLVSEDAWLTELPWRAIQRVQVSAFDGQPRPANNYSDVVGGNYAVNIDLATSLVAEVERDRSTASCGALSGGLPANSSPGSHGLPASFVIPPTASAAEAHVVAYAVAQLDKPYVFGAAGPAAFDCSGLTSAAWAQAGVALPHWTVAQALAGTPTSPAAMVPGDLVLVAGDDGSLAAPGHVGMYIGAGLVINASSPETGIRVQTYGNFVQVGHGLAGIRHVG